jgi:hypothetical protein
MRYRNKSEKLVSGVGFNDLIDQPVYIGGVLDYTYQLWKGMIDRCYSSGALSRCPTYSGCKVSEEFLTYSTFKKFVTGLKGFGCRDVLGRRYQMDKDLLGDGRTYSRDTICFVPQMVNKFLTDSRSARGDLPIGVSRGRKVGMFYSYVSVSGKRVHLGTFRDPVAAFECYKAHKEGLARKIALEVEGLVDERVVDSLKDYHVKMGV